MPVAKKRRVDVDASVPGLVNSAYLMKVRSWYDAVLSSPRGKLVRARGPREPVEKPGLPFGNVFRLDPGFLALPDVMIFDENVKALKKHYFGGEVPLGTSPVLKVKDTFGTVSDAWDAALAGKLECISPPEKWHAYLWGLSDRLALGDLSSETITCWLEWGYDVKFSFVKITGNGLFWAHSQEREDVDVDGHAMGTTTLMRIMQINSFNAMQPAVLSAPVLTEEYRRHLRLSPYSEPVKEGFVDSAMTVASRLLALPGITPLLAQCDSCQGSPLNRIAVLQAIVSKARTPVRIAYVVSGIIDSFYNGSFKEKSPSLSDFRCGGVVEMYILKLGLKDYFLGQFLHRQGWDRSVSDVLATVFSDFSSYRSRCGYSHSALTNKDFLNIETDESFRTQLSGSAEAFFCMVEEICFSASCDQLLKDLQHKGLNPHDCITHGRIKELVDKVLTLREAEMGKGNNPETVVAQLDEEEAATAPPAVESSFKVAALLTVPQALWQGEPDLDWDALAHTVDRSMRRCITLLPGDLPMEQLKKEVGSSPAGKFVPLASAESLMNAVNSSSSSNTDRLYRGRVLVVYDVATSGEANSRAQYRSCPLRRDHLKRMMTMVQEVRASVPGGAQDQLHPADLYMIFDSGKTGLKTQIMNLSFDKQMDIDYKYLQIVLDTGSLMQNMVHHHGILNQLVGCHSVTSSTAPLRPSAAPRPVFAGLASGNVIGPVKVPSWGNSTTWALPVVEKYAVYGSENRVPVGGVPTEQGDFTECEMKKMKDEQEVVFFKSWPVELCLDIIKTYKVQAVVHLTGDDGPWAIASWQASVPYTGICFNELHCSALKTHVQCRLLELMMGNTYGDNTVLQMMNSTTSPVPTIPTAKQPVPTIPKGKQPVPTIPKGKQSNPKPGAHLPPRKATPPQQETLEDGADNKKALMERLKQMVNKGARSKPVDQDEVYEEGLGEEELMEEDDEED